VCTWFVAGWLNYVKHDMYDIAIEIVSSNSTTGDSGQGVSGLSNADLSF